MAEEQSRMLGRDDSGRWPLKWRDSLGSLVLLKHCAHNGRRSLPVRRFLVRFRPAVLSI
jgi:hypothetical protein